MSSVYRLKVIQQHHRLAFSEAEYRLLLNTPKQRDYWRLVLEQRLNLASLKKKTTSGLVQEKRHNVLSQTFIFSLKTDLQRTMTIIKIPTAIAQ